MAETELMRWEISQGREPSIIGKGNFLKLHKRKKKQNRRKEKFKPKCKVKE